MSKIITAIIDPKAIEHLQNIECAAKKAMKAMDDLSDTLKKVKAEWTDFFEQI